MNEPSVIDLGQVRDVRGIVALAGRLYWRHPLLFLTLGLAVIAPWELGILALTAFGPFGHHDDGIGTWLLVELLRASLVGPLISALHIHAVVLIGDGKRPKLTQVALNGLRVLPVVVAAEIIANLGIFIGLLAFFVPGLLLSLRWAVVAQAAAVERGGWIDALHRSAALTRERYVHVFGLTLLGGLISEGVLAGGAALPLGSTSGVASVAVGIAFNTATASFVALTLALLYFDLLARLQQPASETRIEHSSLHDLD